MTANGYIVLGRGDDKNVLKLDSVNGLHKLVKILKTWSCTTHYMGEFYDM